MRGAESPRSGTAAKQGFPSSSPRNTSSASGAASARLPHCSVPVIVHHGHQPVEREQSRAPAHLGRERIGIGADMVGAIEPAAGEGKHRWPVPQAAFRFSFIITRSAITASGNPLAKVSASGGIYWVNMPARSPAL